MAVTPKQNIEERRQWISGFNDMMVKIWLEQIAKLDVFSISNHSGNLFRSVRLTHSQMNGEVTDISLGFEFAEYGIYVDRGTGREIAIGNPGDIGRPKIREAKPWFSKKFIRSFYRLRNYMSDSIGREFCLVVPSVMGQVAIK